MERDNGNRRTSIWAAAEYPIIRIFTTYIIIIIIGTVSTHPIIHTLIHTLFGTLLRTRPKKITAIIDAVRSSLLPRHRHRPRNRRLRVQATEPAPHEHRHRGTPRVRLDRTSGGDGATRAAGAGRGLPCRFFSCGVRVDGGVGGDDHDLDRDGVCVCVVMGGAWSTMVWTGWINGGDRSGGFRVDVPVAWKDHRLVAVACGDGRSIPATGIGARCWREEFTTTAERGVPDYGVAELEPKKSTER